METQTATSKEPFTLLTAAELITRLHISRTTLREWNKQGCPGVSIGTHPNSRRPRRRYNLAAVLEWLDTRHAPTAPAKDATGKEVRQ